MPFSQHAASMTAEDLVAVYNLISRYARALDTRDYAAYVANFLPDGVLIDHSTGAHCEGRQQIMAFLDARDASGRYSDPRQHVISLPNVEGDAASCTARTYWHVILRKADDTHSVWSFGEYVDRIVKAGGRWYFAERVIWHWPRPHLGVPDQAFLLGLVDEYLRALAANDPGRLPLAPTVRFTENCQPLQLGKGLWATATPFQVEPHFFSIAECATGQVAYLGVVQEAGRPALLALRLGVRDGAIEEIETLVCRDPQGGIPRVFAPDNMRVPREQLSGVLQPEERTPRAEMIRIVNRYFDGVLSSTGSMIPVHGSCIRIANGVQTVGDPNATDARGLGVAQQVDTGRFKEFEAARERRFVVVDEERGIAFVMFFWDHPGPTVASGGSSRYPQPTSVMVAEAFRIRGGKLAHIEAVLNVFPYGTRSQWERCAAVRPPSSAATT